jgi:hypothetical protein
MPSTKTFWFGTLYDTAKPGTSSISSNAQMSLVPVPDVGMGAGGVGYSELLEFENGGADVISAAATHRVYNCDWNLREATGASGLDVIWQYQQKYFGPGLIYFADPMIFDRNMFSPAWASPGLIEQGWKSIYDTAPTFANTTANSYSQPRRTATFSVTNAANAAPTGSNSIQVIPIPPTHTLWLGISAVATGTAIVAVRGINPDGSYGSVTTPTLIAPTSATRMNFAFAGSTYKAVEVYITRTTTATSTLAVTSAMAQLWPSAITPIQTGVHIPGQGNNGCKFGSDAIVQNYTLADIPGGRHYKGMSADIVEVGAWQ